MHIRRAFSMRIVQQAQESGCEKLSLLPVVCRKELQQSQAARRAGDHGQGMSACPCSAGGLVLSVTARGRRRYELRR